MKEDEDELDLMQDLKTVLDERLQEDETTYLTVEESINQLNKKYGL